MKSNFLIPLGSLCLALPAVRQLHIGQQFTPPFTTDATTEATINTQASPNIALTTKIPTASLITRSGESVSAAPRSLDQLKSLILDGLENSPDTNLFAALLRGQPDLFKLLNPESDYTILAPNNSAVKRANLPYLREGMGYSHQLALSFVERGPVDPPLAAGPRTLKTTLRDIKYVGLGPGQSARLVSSPEGAGLRIVSGMQQGVAFGGQAYPFGAGAIYVGEEQVHPPFPSLVFPPRQKANIYILQLFRAPPGSSLHSHQNEWYWIPGIPLSHPRVQRSIFPGTGNSFCPKRCRYRLRWRQSQGGCASPAHHTELPGVHAGSCPREGI